MIDTGAEARAAGRALCESWEHLIAALPTGWMRRVTGAVVGVTQVPAPPFNGAWVHAGEARAEEVTPLLDAVAATGMPHGARLGPETGDELRRAVRARGMQREPDIPLMVLSGAGTLRQDAGALPASAGRCAIRPLEPGEAQLHADLAAAGFGAPAELFRGLMTTAVFELPGVRGYVGSRDGEPVATGVGVQIGDAVGIFNVATLETERRQGWGAAITTRAVRDGLAAGAEWAWLQSSDAGLRVYERLGFRTVAMWESWLSA